MLAKYLHAIAFNSACVARYGVQYSPYTGTPAEGRNTVKHFAEITEGALSAACDDYAEFNLHDWLDGDDRLVTVYFNTSAADHDDCLPTATIIGAATSAEHGFSEVFDRAGFAGLIGEKYAAMIEEAKAEEGQ